MPPTMFSFFAYRCKPSSPSHPNPVARRPNSARHPLGRSAENKCRHSLRESRLCGEVIRIPILSPRIEFTKMGSPDRAGSSKGPAPRGDLCRRGLCPPIRRLRLRRAGSRSHLTSSATAAV